MKYIKVKQVKQRARELGFRSSPSFLAGLDAVVEHIIKMSGNWTAPQKTMKMKNVIAYCQHHKMKV